ncbi:MAG: bifunctional methylenetetrahydrofolate dehydrogenase/methenyltetrahydrofolate cyclohydrolase FolD [Candidatus Aminicenantia bacterium]
MGKWLRGDSLAEEIKEKVKVEIEELYRKTGKTPGLTGILIGENPSSKIYLNIKSRECGKLNIRSELIKFSENVEEEALLKEIDRLNKDDNVDGILVQLPIPSHLDPLKIIERIYPEKDVDGFHPVNLGNLILGKDGFRACTPSGIMELLKKNSIQIRGKRAVVVGRSFIVGKPMGIMLLNEDATLTYCHSKTENLSEITSTADILIVAMGKPFFINKNFVKEGAVVIDVGVNSIKDKGWLVALIGDNQKKLRDIEEKGSTLLGDVHPEVIDKASFLTPVPGGVGPLTVAMLMSNTLKAFKMRRL